jgi:N-glycosylase/DNA lyase
LVVGGSVDREGGMESILAKDFSLEKTLECGQFFRYEKKGNFYLVSMRNRLFKVRQEGERLYFGGAPKKFIIRFFGLDADYRKILSSISKDDFIKKAIKENWGMRIIRQDPWECLISYICSANNNIPRIKKNVDMLSERFGREISHDSHKSYSFPNPGELSDHDKIFSCKVGFRSRFIHEANKTVDEKGLELLKGKSYKQAREELIKLKGVGEKIADCVCLFSLDKPEAFPVDVWIRRVMLEQYFNDKGEKEKKRLKNSEIGDFARGYFGRYAGYANQFLFYYRRLQK